MTVRDLVDKLQELPQNLRVVFSDDGSYFDVSKVEEIRHPDSNDRVVEVGR